ncbi:hypothetical protein [Halococcus agarilyticus]|uniref:hypothetical protein n=1 Tax=Halococcus agarilyticus TaxID=1232219 RepID=UPI0009ACB466|nr:hypothetical protein [Halococcus agarilyticus]
MREALDGLRRPAYTGERRCWPCTALNAGLLGLACAVIARATPIGAAGVGIAGGAAIALRGYLVPYTPQIAPRLVAHLPLDVSHGASIDEAERPPSHSPGSLADDPSGEAVTDRLLDAGVLVAEGETLVLDEWVRERWRDGMASLRALESDALADAVRATVDATTTVDRVETADGEWFVLSEAADTVASERWLSRPVAIAEVGAVEALDALPRTDRLAAARPLRLFLERCPACEGPVEVTTTAACCGGPGSNGPEDVLACTACERRVFTYPE